MSTNEKCFLCLGKADVEDVPRQQGIYLEVVCTESCPQYQITTTVIAKMKDNDIKRKSILHNMKEVAKTGKKPIISFSIEQGVSISSE